MKKLYFLTAFISIMPAHIFCVESIEQAPQQLIRLNLEINRPTGPKTHKSFLKTIQYLIKAEAFVTARRTLERWVTFCEKNPESPKVNAYLEDIARMNSKIQRRVQSNGASIPLYTTLNSRITNLQEQSRLHVVC